MIYNASNLKLALCGAGLAFIRFCGQASFSEFTGSPSTFVLCLYFSLGFSLIFFRGSNFALLMTTCFYFLELNQNRIVHMYVQDPLQLIIFCAFGFTNVFSLKFYCICINVIRVFWDSSVVYILYQLSVHFPNILLHSCLLIKHIIQFLVAWLGWKLILHYFH